MSAHPHRPWYREHFVWLLIALPALAVVAGLYSLYLAIVSNDGLVADDYYQQGKTINRVIARDQAAAALGLEAALTLDPVQHRVQLVLRAQKAFTAPPQLRLNLAHATRGNFDQSLTLTRDTDGTYRARLPELVPGRWNTELEGDNWRLTGAVHIPNDTHADLRPDI